MSDYVGAAASAVGGIMQLIAINKGKKAREEEQRRANERLAEMQSRYERLDTSNPYANLENRFAENVYEDLTVNQQQAQFMAQQGAQQRADTLQQLRGTAGASGIAGLAQVMANQGQLQAQQAAASIGQQEARNQQLAAQGQLRVQAGASAVDLAKAKGETISRQWEQSKVATLFGVAQQEKAAADAARQRALNQQIEAWGTIAGGVTQGVGAAQDDAAKLLTMGGGGGSI
tara:strand:+ start:1789 stop:2481 length:693 start_codon:yes stop_codon:yes gene_type:complete